MKLVGYIKLFDSAPSFTLLVFRENEEPDYFVQDISWDGMRVHDFRLLKVESNQLFEIDDGPVIFVGSTPLYGILETQDNFVYGPSDALLGFLSLELKKLPLSFQMQIYDIVGDDKKKSEVRRDYSKQLASNNGYQRAKYFLESSISSTGWRSLLTKVHSKGESTKFSDIKLSELLFYLDGSQEIQFQNLSPVKFDKSIINEVIAELRSEYRLDAKILSEFKPNSHTLQAAHDKLTSESFFDKDALFTKLNYLISGFGRQEDRLAVCVALAIVYPKMLDVIIMYNDRAQSGRAGIRTLKNFQLAGNINDDRTVYHRVINVIEYKWQTGDRSVFLHTLSILIFFIDDELYKFVSNKLISRSPYPYRALLKEAKEVAIAEGYKDSLRFPSFLSFIDSPKERWSGIILSMISKFIKLEKSIMAATRGVDK